MFMLGIHELSEVRGYYSEGMMTAQAGALSYIESALLCPVGGGHVLCLARGDAPSGPYQISAVPH